MIQLPFRKRVTAYSLKPRFYTSTRCYFGWELPITYRVASDFAAVVYALFVSGEPPRRLSLRDALGARE